jgi:FtsZ-binding cell division protein ZapB
VGESIAGFNPRIDDVSAEIREKRKLLNVERGRLQFTGAVIGDMQTQLRIQALAEEIDELMRERDRLEKDKDALVKKEDALVKEKHALVQERLMLQEERLLLAKRAAEGGTAHGEEQLPADWKSFCEALGRCTVHSIGSGSLVGASVLRLPHGISWGADGRKGCDLIVRSCYEPIMKRIVKVWEDLQSPVVLLGTPGVGKSMFRFYVLWWLVRQFVSGEIREETMSVAWDQLPAPSSSASDSSLLVMDFCRDAGVDGGLLVQGRQFAPSSRANNFLRVHPVFYIADSVPPQYPIHTRSCILEVSSPRESRWKEFAKQSIAVLSYMPLWSFEELCLLSETLAPGAMSVADVKKRFAGVGGSARAVVDLRKIVDANEYVGAALDRVSASALWEMETVDTREDSMSDRLVHMVVDEVGMEDAVEFAWKGPYSRFSSDYASEYVRQLVVQKIDVAHHAHFRALFSATSELRKVSSLRWSMCEEFVHSFILSNPGRLLRLRPLGAASSASSDLTFQIPPLKRKSVAGVSVLREVSDDEYGVPVSPCFPVIDAIIGHSSMIQITIDPRHGLNCVAAEKLWQAWFDHGIAPPGSMYWLVPPPVFLSFPVQSLSHLSKATDDRCRTWLTSLQHFVVEIGLEPCQ